MISKPIKISTYTKHSARRGVLTFEWLLICTLVVIGIVGGLAVLRDAVVGKYVMAGGALGALDMSYNVPAYTGTNTDITAPKQSFSGGTFDVTLQAPAAN